MAYLPLANLMHYKLRSVLSALGVSIGICMVITLSGLARGTLYEVAERWEGVRADLIVFPRGWGGNATDKSGAALSDKYADEILQQHGDIVAEATPVFTWNIDLGGQNQMATGVRPGQWATISGGRKLREGRLFDPNGAFERWIEWRLLASKSESQDAQEISEKELADPAHNGLEIVIDELLARAGHYKLGQKVRAAEQDWTIVGIAPAGVMTRVSMPLRTAQWLFGSGMLKRSTLIFLKLRPGVSSGPAARAIAETTKQDVVQIDDYRGMLVARWGMMFKYVDMVNFIAMGIAFLFTMTTLYTTVLQRTREVAILRSCGASGFFIIRQVLAESAMLTGAGFAAGVGMSFAAAWAIETAKPLYTVSITWQWVLIAGAIAAGGAIAAALYPARRATRVDMVEALSLE